MVGIVGSVRSDQTPSQYLQCVRLYILITQTTLLSDSSTTSVYIDTSFNPLELPFCSRLHTSTLRYSNLSSIHRDSIYLSATGCTLFTSHHLIAQQVEHTSVQHEYLASASSRAVEPGVHQCKSATSSTLAMSSVNISGWLYCRP
jgi:hypothetical protein